ncbi:MAG: N-acetylmuramoyl-L-alanine amidase family 2 [Acidimicrobiales bacterium]|nr:N-acetylmuramoyl-L-alanine amidase family 2 [Acidimicrobiales bacterium]
MGRTRSSLVGRILLLVGLTGSVLLAVGAPPASAATTSRLAGSDRYATAAVVSQSTFGVGVPVAYVVTGRNFPDALAAGAAAAKRRGPVLLVDGGRIPPVIADELTRLQPAEITVVGGPAAIPDSVVTELQRYTSGTVTRVSGAERWASAAAVSRAAFPTAATVYVANGDSYPDALAGVPAAAKDGAPLLLVTAHGLPSSTAEEIRRTGARRIVVLGGQASVDAAVESQLRAIAPDVVRAGGGDRYGTAATLSAQSASPGVPAVYLATGSAFADALSGGPAAATAGAPILLVRGNCIPAAVNTEINRLAPGRIILLGGAGALASGVEDRTQCPAAGTPAKTVAVSPTAAPAWNDAGPDPDLLRVGTTWYAYTTGTTWGNNIGVLTSTSPSTGWHTTTGKPYGSTALGPIPGWQRPDTQWAPGVFAFAGKYVLFYAAQQKSTGQYCITVATAASPTGPFIDRSSGPLICQANLGGSIDPQPFLDADGRPWLHWKNNDGSSPAVSRVWAVQLTGDGVNLEGPIREVLAKDSQKYPWMTTVDNPQMVIAGGVHYLFFTGGNWESAGYATGYAVCSGPAGPCTPAPNPILTSYGNAAGPGGGTVAQDPSGAWWLSYHAWDKGCTNDGCGGTRRLYVAPLTFR